MLGTCDGGVVGLKWNSCILGSEAGGLEAGAGKNMEETKDREMCSQSTSSRQDTPTILMSSLQLWLATQELQETGPSAFHHREGEVQETQLGPQGLLAVNSCWGKGVIFLYVAATKFSLLQEIS